MFWASLLLGGLWIGLCKAVDWWRARPGIREIPRPKGDYIPVNFGGELVFWHPETVRAVQQAIARGKAVEARRAQEAEAKRG